MSKRITGNCRICNKSFPINKLSYIKDEDLNLNLGYLCNDCIENKSDEINEIAPELTIGILNSGRVDLVTDSAEILDPKNSKASAEIKSIANEFGVDNKQDDLMYIKFKLVHANTNKNKDKFTIEELKAAEKTPILKMLNWEHGEPNIGVIYSSKFVNTEDNDENSYIECLAAVSKFKYKSLAKEMYERYLVGNLKFSMETWFKGVKCSICAEYFDKGEEDYCEHLKKRYAEGSSAERILVGITFAGAGVVENPADIEAESLLLASENNKKENKEALSPNMTFTQEQVDALVAEAVAKTQSELEAQIKELNEKISVFETVAGELETEKTAKAEIESKLASISIDFENLQKEFASEKRAVAWISELKVIGYEIPELAQNKDEYDGLFNKLKTMDENSFILMKEMVAKVLVNLKDSKASIKENKEIKDVLNGDGNLPITSAAITDNKKTSTLTTLLTKVLN